MKIEIASPSGRVLFALCFGTVCVCLVFVGIGFSRWSSGEYPQRKLINGTEGPSPVLSPSEVVAKQMAALHAITENESKIEECYSFASPSNRAAVGGSHQLLSIVRKHYTSLIDNEIWQIGDAFEYGTESAVLVTLVTHNYEVHAYLFYLSKQQKPPYRDCWMTDGVERLHIDSNRVSRVSLDESK